MFIGNNDFKTKEELLHFSNLLKLAETIASVAHENQVDKIGKPYIIHPQTVSSYCETTYGKIVGFLHDVVEDTEVTLEDLKHLGFDDFLIEALRCVTKEAGYNEEEYYLRIKNNPIAKEVKLADLKHNTDTSRLPDTTDQVLLDKMLKKNEFYKSRIEYLNS